MFRVIFSWSQPGSTSLEKVRVIKKVDNSDWVSPTVYVKNKRIRVGVNFSMDINDSLKDHSYPLPSSKDNFSKLNRGKIFSKIDMSEAYLQVKVDEKCSKYLTIRTHQGFYALRCLPFGLKVALNLFQQIKDAMLAGQDYAMANLDDKLIKTKKYGTT